MFVRMASSVPGQFFARLDTEFLKGCRPADQIALAGGQSFFRHLPALFRLVQPGTYLAKGLNKTYKFII